jgi:hypothetical protein
MKQNYSIVLLVILLMNGLLISQTDNNSFHRNDVFQTVFFIEHNGRIKHNRASIMFFVIDKCRFSSVLLYQ